MLTITAISAFSDNYIWCLSDPGTGKALVVDPGQAEPVNKHLEQHNLTLDRILITHHHGDHIGGVPALRNAWPDCQVTAPADSPFQGGTETVGDGDTVQWLNIRFRVIGVPGHTLDHVAYFTETEIDGDPVLFCGDTLFVCGCGRVFEGTPEQMRQSLLKLRSLPDRTRVYCAHEYTLANLRFARSVLPEDEALEQFEAQCQKKREAGEPTVPSDLGQEKRLNPFMRWDDPTVIEAARNMHGADEEAETSEDSVFTALRQAKDKF